MSATLAAQKAILIALHDKCLADTMRDQITTTLEHLNAPLRVLELEQVLETETPFLILQKRRKKGKADAWRLAVPAHELMQQMRVLRVSGTTVHHVSEGVSRPMATGVDMAGAILTELGWRVSAKVGEHVIVLALEFELQQAAQAVLARRMVGAGAGDR